jgi:FKBP12-rapamycin complex-associated protein
VEGCDTLNELIKDYRVENKLRVYLERENYEKICPEYAYLPIMNKLEVFLTVLESGQGKDLLRIFWYNSENS